MKKLLSVFLILTLICSFVSAAGSSEKSADTIESKIELGQKMTSRELLEKAKEESGSFYVYGNTSRIAQAVSNFVALYGAELNLSDANAAGTKMNDTDIYTTLFQEAAGGGSKVASMVMIQDGAQLSIYRQNSSIMLNYVPSTLSDKVDENDLLPLVHQYINKLFIWNNIGDNAPVITNVWQLTEASLKDKVFFKNPTAEQVNMNFLIMCTSPAWSEKLAQAYKDYYGKEIELGTYQNAGYKWVAEFIANVNFSISSDTTICQTMAKADSEGCLGLFVLSKFRDVDPSIKGNLTIGAFTEAQINPFSGFMYPMYVQMTAKCPRPYTTMLFINYLMSSEGFTPWGGAGTDILGAYSSNPDIGAAEGDRDITFWKNCLVSEDASYIMVNKSAVTDFVNSEIAKK